MMADTGKIPQALLGLVEKLAEEVHEAWSRQRLADGWRYGPQRDDLKKEHPCLVPYKDLPEAEKEYDRQSALRTIQAILGWGFSLEPPAATPVGGPLPSSPGSSAEAAALQVLWQDLPRLDLPQTLRLCQVSKFGSACLPEGAEAALGQHLLGLGEPLLAYDLISKALESRPGDLRLRQLQGLALLRSGAVEKASQVLQKLAEEGHQDEETLGLLARVAKELAAQTSDPGARQKHWRQAYELYAGAYEHTGGYWTGINAATLARYLGEKDKAVALARRVTEQCLAALANAAGDPGEIYWLRATLGEAALIREEWLEAENWFSKAARLAGGRYGDLASTRRNVRLLLAAMEEAPDLRERLEACFRIPPVVVFSGHLIDQPGRPCPRFPAALEPWVAREIATALERLEARIGVSSAACGSDILFLEAMQARGGETIVILPIRPEEFRRSSVDLIPGADWSPRFDAVLHQASRLIVASENRATGDELTYAYANLIQDGLAILRAGALDTNVHPLAVWDGKAGDLPGGTHALVRHWQDRGRRPEIIDTARLLAGLAPEALPAAPAPGPPRRNEGHAPEAGAFTQEIKAILFADVVGSGRIREEQVPAFVEHFMGAIRGLITESFKKPLLTNTWGDALYAVFDSLEDAGGFALNLRDRIAGADWPAQGLPPGLNLRISLHAGPVYCYQQPLFQELAYAGSHIVWAARIEPITPPGQVYASQQFAALASARGVAGLAFEYAGQVPLPKQAGILPLYLVRRPDLSAAGNISGAASDCSPGPHD
jgi:class 3 adenylate cyclase